MKILVIVLFLAAVSVFADADHLLLTEICVTPTPGEFIEIYNPTAEYLSLDDVHLCDVYGDSSSVEYFYPQLGLGPMTQSSSDFVAMFPDENIVAPGEYVVVALDGDAFNTTYGFSADFDIRGTGGGATPMTTAYWGYIGASAGLTNGDELVTMFYYEDYSDSNGRCYDIDYAIWGDNTDRRVDKTGIVVPPAVYYLPDTPVIMQTELSDGSHPSGSSFQRYDFSEGGETFTGGNGLTGHDETSESLVDTWLIGLATPGSGYTALERETWGAIKATF